MNELHLCKIYVNVQVLTMNLFVDKVRKILRNGKQLIWSSLGQRANSAEIFGPKFKAKQSEAGDHGKSWPFPPFETCARLKKKIDHAKLTYDLSNFKIKKKTYVDQ